MKTLIRLATLSLITVVLLTATAAAQSRDDLRARGIHTEYESGKADGMRVVVYKQEAETLTPVDPSHVFTKGNKMKIAFESNFNGYAYVINIEPTGKKRVLFPHGKAANVNNSIQARQRYVLPFSGSFVFDEQKGVEIIQVIMSRQPISYLEDAIKTSNGELGETASSAAAELASVSKRGGVSANEVARVLPDDASGGLRARGVKLAIGKDGEETGTVAIAIPDDKPRPDDKNKDGKLKSDYIVLEVRLQHN